MKVALMLGHWGKRSRPKDRGATSGDAVEAHIAAKLLVASAIEIEKLGHEALMLTYDNYKEREEFANMMNSNFLFAFHLNSAEKPGNYGLILYDDRGPLNREYSKDLVFSLAKIFPYRWTVKPLGHGDRGFNNIEWAIMPAFIMEWGFVNNPDHVKFINENIDKIAATFAKTVTKL